MDAGTGRRFACRVIMLATCVLPAVMVTSVAGTPGGSGETRTSKPVLLERISAAVSGIERISCRFVQERRTALLELPMISSGRFDYRAPDCLRWEVTQPDAYGFSVCRSEARQWKGKAGPSRSFSMDAEPGLKQFTDQVFAWIRADFPWLENRYRISVVTSDPATLKLAPLSAADPGGIRQMIISFAPQLSHVETVDIQEADGDSTCIRFSEVVINGPFNEDLFQ